MGPTHSGRRRKKPMAEGGRKKTKVVTGSVDYSHRLDVITSKSGARRTHGERAKDPPSVTGSLNPNP